MTVRNISKRGSVVIPAELRKKYGLKAGTRVWIDDSGDGIAIRRLLESPLAAAFGMLAGKTSLTKALLAERAKELEREERRFSR